MKTLAFLISSLFCLTSTQADVGNWGSADLNGDGIVDSSDYAIAAQYNDWDSIILIAANWLTTQPGSADMNGDGVVNFADYAMAAEYKRWYKIIPILNNWLTQQQYVLSYGPNLAGSDGSGNCDANAINIDSVSAFRKLVLTPGDWYKHFKQSTNIDFKGSAVNSIGYYDTNVFAGTYDGQYFTISNVNIIRNSNDRYNTFGIFGCVGQSGKLLNMRISNACIRANSSAKDNFANVGALAGWLLDGAVIMNCQVNASIFYTHNTPSSNVCAIGILAGQNAGQISNCSTSGSITFSCTSPSSYVRIGGVLGWQWGGTILGFTQNCSSNATIQCTSWPDAVNMKVGGVCGYLEDYQSTVRNYLRYCKWDGTLDVISTDPNTVMYVGGVVGHGHSDFDSCLAQGTINVNSAATVNNTYYGGLCVGGISGLMTDNMARCGADCNLSVSYATKAYVGGAVGDSYYAVSINDCYALGTLYDLNTGSYTLAFPSGGGGFAGRIVGLNPTRCWCATRHAFVPGNSVVSAFSGVLFTAGPIGCFWNEDVISDSNSQGLTGKTTLELETQSTFTDAGYDFTITPVWTIQPVCFPTLEWQTSTSFGPPQ